MDIKPMVGDIWRCSGDSTYREPQHALVTRLPVNSGPSWGTGYQVVWLETGEIANLGFSAANWTYEKVA